MPILPHYVTETRPAPSTLATIAPRYAHRRGDRWAPVPPELDALIASDPDLAEAARRARVRLVTDLARRFGFHERYLDAVFLVPRERFVLPEDLGASADDTPLALERSGQATVSAPHAYLLTYALLGLTEGDHLLELGTGTGYGAALARHIVGRRGSVTSIEIDPALHHRAARLLGAAPGGAPDGISLLLGDGRSLAAQVLSGRIQPGPALPRKIAVTYALSRVPAELEQLLPEGGVLVAPVGSEDAQELVRVERAGGALRRRQHGAVRYVTERFPE